MPAAGKAGSGGDGEENEKRIGCVADPFGRASSAQSGYRTAALQELNHFHISVYLSLTW
jgi:hypothetical protein